MIRTEEHFEWNLLLLLILLALMTVLTLAQWTGFPGLGLLYDPDSITGSAIRIFFHADLTHFFPNLLTLLVLGSILAGFAHPVEFAGLTGLTISAFVLYDHYWLGPMAGGLSALLFPFLGAVLVFLPATAFDTGHLERFRDRVLAIAFALGLLVFVVAMQWNQVVHDIGVVVQGQPIGRGYPSWYSPLSSTVHVYGTVWGLVCALALRLTRHRLR